MFPLDLMQNLVPLLAPDTEAFLTVFSPLVQHCQQEAASTSLVSPSLCCCPDVKTSLGSPPWPPPTIGLPTLTGRAQVVSLSFLGLFLFPTLLLEKDLAMADQFLKGVPGALSWTGNWI